jgi:hypothetical protein
LSKTRPYVCSRRWRDNKRNEQSVIIDKKKKSKKKVALEISISHIASRNDNKQTNKRRTTMTTSTTNNSTRVQLMNENPTNAYYMLVTTSELNTTFQDLYCFFMNVAANRGEVYTSKLNEESTRMALLQMNNAGAFDTK